MNRRTITWRKATLADRPLQISHSHAQVVQRAGHSLSALLKDVGIDHRRSQIAVSEKLLDCPDVSAALQKMCREGMPKRVGTDVFRQARPLHAGFDGLVDDAGIDVVAARDARTWIHRQVAGWKQGVGLAILLAEISERGSA